MRLSQLLYFEAAGRLESVTKAAEELHVSQPSISMSIKELESELGVALFQRVNKRLYLTEEGRYFLSELSQILRQLDRLTKEMKERGSDVQHLRVAVAPIIGMFIFPAVFREFRLKHPEINIVTPITLTQKRLWKAAARISLSWRRTSRSCPAIRFWR